MPACKAMSRESDRLPFGPPCNIGSDGSPGNFLSQSILMPNVQIFGVKDSHSTRAAQRFFKERGIKFQFVDLTQKTCRPLK